jgi:hypothetical protein
MTSAERSTKGGEFLIERTPVDGSFTPEDFSEEQRPLAETTERFLVREVPAIEIFAMESAVLRAEKAATASAMIRAEAMAATVKVCACQGAAAMSQAAARAAAYIEEGKQLESLSERIETFCRYNASGLLIAKRTLAAGALKAESYIF